MTPKSFFAVTNIRVQVVSLSPVLLGTLMAVVKNVPFRWPELALMAFSAAALGMGTTAWNTAMDYLKGVDTDQTHQAHAQTLLRGAASPGGVLVTAVVLFALGSLSGLVLSILITPFLIPVGIFCLLVALFYSAGPLPFSRTPLGEIVVALTQGSILFCLSYFVEARALSQDVLWLSVPSGVFVALVLTVNNNCDRRGDQAAGRRTLSILLGPASRWLVPGLGIGGILLFASAMAAPVFKPWSMVGPLFLAVVGIPLVWRMDRRGYSPKTKGPNMSDALGLFTLFTMIEAGILGVQRF